VNRKRLTSKVSLGATFLVVGVIALACYQLSNVLLILPTDSVPSDRDYQLDWDSGQRSVGTALRVANDGLLGGRPRYYVILLNGVGDEVVVLYEGIALYPDDPPRPEFQSASNGKVTYELEEDGKPFLKTFDINIY
jgi:hypothetical protein